MNNRRALTPKAIWKAFMDYDLWPVSTICPNEENRVACFLLTLLVICTRTHLFCTTRYSNRLSNTHTQASQIQHSMFRLFTTIMPNRLLKNLTNIRQFTTNLLTIPATVAGSFTLLGITYFSEYINERAFVASIQNVWALPCLIALLVWPGSLVDAWGTFAIITVLLSYPYCHAIRKC